MKLCIRITVNLKVPGPGLGNQRQVGPLQPAARGPAHNHSPKSIARVY